MHYGLVSKGTEVPLFREPESSFDCDEEP